MDFFVDQKHLFDKGNDILQISSELRSTMNQIESLILSVDGEWQGDSEKIYASKIVYIKKQYQHIETILDDYARLLFTASEKYETLDEEFAQKINVI